MASKGFDFASDDILCSYEDYANQEQSNGTHSDSAIGNNSVKEYNKSRMSRTSILPNSSYSPTDDSGNQEVIIMAVERSMKKHTDNVMRFLEGLSSRLSQLELYCYNLDKSIGEMRSDLTQDHDESDSKLKSLENHLQEVNRSVQILRDKQELADTQKELAKVKLARKESSSSHNSQQNDDHRSSTPDSQKKETSHGQQLALVPAPQPPAAYYLPSGPTPTQLNQTQYPQPQQPPQWTPQVQPGSRPSSPQVYPQYLPTKPPVNPSEPLPMQMTYSTIPPPGSNQPMTYSYSGPVRTAQHQPQPSPQQQPQHLKPGYGGQPDGYMVYDNESGRVQHPSQGGQFYPLSQQQTGGFGGGGGMMSRPAQQFMNNHHPYNEVVDKLVSMGYRGDHVMSVIQRLDESGQTVDFNAVLDKLNGQRGWSG